MREKIKYVTFDVTPIVCVRVIEANDMTLKKLKPRRENIRLNYTMMFL